MTGMPKVTIWIREDDYLKWQAIGDIPTWLHEHLNIGAAGMNTAIALQDMKAGDYGTVYVQPPIQGEPVYPLDDPHPGQLHNEFSDVHLDQASKHQEIIYTDPEDVA